jgi:hypothetical protein
MPTMNRRSFCAGAAAGAIAGGAVGWLGSQRLKDGLAERAAPAEPAAKPTFWPIRGQAPIAAVSGQFGLPGPFCGRVIEVNHPGVVEVDNTGEKPVYTRRQGVVKAMIERGMCELVGSDDAVQAWKYFFSPGDRVGIKVVPNGYPSAMSSSEIVLEVIAGLQSAGARLKDMLLFDRYLNEFLRCGYVKRLPAGVHWECSTAPGAAQVAIDGQPVAEPTRVSEVSGYDPDVWRELPYADPQFPEHDDRRFRSHLCNIVSKKVDKLVCIPVLKDHRSAGVTITLKNMSHGFVNNVNRSHLAPSNTCESFIPAMVSLPQIRQKAVLQVVDGLVGVYEGGPSPSNPSFAAWARRSLFVATDPVAMDRIGWEMDADFVVFSMHKAYGPSGVGVLYAKRKRMNNLSPLLLGGETVDDATYDSHALTQIPNRFEAGLQNYAGVVGSDAACDFVMGFRGQDIAAHYLALNAQARQELAQLPRVSILGPADSALRGSIVNFTIEGKDSFDVARVLDRAGNIMVRPGKHCAHAWCNARGVGDSIRVSFGLYNDATDVARFLAVRKDVIRFF